MNREEILAKSRAENKEGDERELKILSDASKVGMAAGGVLSVMIIFFSRMIDEPMLGLSAWSVYFTMFGSRRLYQYIQTKEKVRLAQALVGAVFGIACVAGMVVLGLKR